MSLVKPTIEDKEKGISIAKTSIINLANAKEALESSLSSLKVQNQELQVQHKKCKNFTTSSLVVDSKASSSNSSTCKYCLKYHASCCLTNHARQNSSKVELEQILKKCYSNDESKKVEPKYKPLKSNNGKRDLGTTHTR
jgi:hypothetical protein